jgi:hypothetical protein
MRDLFRRGFLRRGSAGPDATSEPEARSRALYVVTLSVSPTPLPLPASGMLPEIGGLAVFRARRMHGSRELHLQQLGYFDSRRAAEALLPQLESEWPAAVVELAAVGGMGSLDDTQVTHFRVLRGAAPPADEGAAASSSAPRPAASAAQSFALQLIRQNVPVDLARVPRLAAFRGRALYRVQAERDGTKTYGLRLGFFTDPASARLVADSVRERFPRVTVVPVSERERDRVMNAGR